MIRKIILTTLLLQSPFLFGLHAQTADEVRDSVKIYFRQGRTELVPYLYGNREALDRISDRLQTGYTDSVFRLRKILVVGGASPEGSVKFNRWLSEQRAGVLFDYLSRYGTLPDSLKTSEFLGRDWNGLIDLVRNDSEVPYREETLRLLDEIALEAGDGGPSGTDHVARLRRLRGGVPYRYMYDRLFPELRASRLYLWYDKTRNPVFSEPPAADVIDVADTEGQSVAPVDTVYIDTCPQCRPFYMDVRTNMLYDALLIPNIGVEFYLGKGWSVVGDWMYGWWKTDRRHFYWRAYGGGLSLRKWFGCSASSKPLTGHHLGVYGQIFTYDFETGGRGYMGGKPGGSLWDKMNYAAGVEYGYSLPVARRLNIDFTVGLGYWGGTYHEYRPVDGCYVWQATKDRHWFGPTKAEVSLVWLIGCGNYNRSKEGGWK